MDLTIKETTLREFENIIKKSPPIFDEILLRLATEHDLPEKDIIVLKNDILFTTLVVIMMNNYFQPKVDNGDLLEDVGYITSRHLDSWKPPVGMYEAEFMLGCCEITIKLMMIPLASTVLVNVVINGVESETYSVCLQVNKYIELTMRETTVAKLFRNLRLLSDTFKNKVLTPVKSKLLSTCGYPGASLLGLPEDVFLKLMLYLPLADILTMCETCRKFRTLVNDNNLWHNLYIRDRRLFLEVEEYNKHSLLVEDTQTLDLSKYQNWKQMYMEYYSEALIIKSVKKV